MATKLGKGEYPGGSGPDDFECFGPPATKDGQFGGTKIADMGCFTQDGKDSNKGYHAAVVKHKKTGDWYVYFEWGRVGAAHPDFQFVECEGEAEAQDEYEAQLHSKNDKRGEWATIAGIRTLRAKAGKDCYLVRPQATRSTGLPDAKRVQMNEGAKQPVQARAPAPDASAKAKPRAKPSVDPQTASLMRDLNLATVKFAKSSMSEGAGLPTQVAIDEARLFITEAQRRLLKVGDAVDAQVRDKELAELTRQLYSRIPKVKPVGADPSTYVLNAGTILGWNMDLDAFEQALYTTVADSASDQGNPLEGMGLEMCWLDARGAGEWVAAFAAGASRDLHGGVGRMRIKNLWRVHRPGDDRRFEARLAQIAAEDTRSGEKPMFEPKSRPDVPAPRSPLYQRGRVALLFHGTRSVNVSGILRSSLRLPNQLKGVCLTGAMFGPGLYMADDWKKSAGYTSLRGSYWSAGGGGVGGRSAFMFLVDVTLGKPYVAPGTVGYNSAPRGFHSVFGKAGRSGVQNNEWIVYDAAQHCLRYLLEFDA